MCVAGFCVSTHLGELHLGEKVIFSWLLFIAPLDFREVVRESTTKIPVRVSVSAVCDP